MLNVSLEIELIWFWYKFKVVSPPRPTRHPSPGRLPCRLFEFKFSVTTVLLASHATPHQLHTETLVPQLLRFVQLLPPSALNKHINEEFCAAMLLNVNKSRFVESTIGWVADAEDAN